MHNLKSNFTRFCLEWSCLQLRQIESWPWYFYIFTSVQMTKFYCRNFFAKIPWNQPFTIWQRTLLYMYSKFIWRKTFLFFACLALSALYWGLKHDHEFYGKINIYSVKLTVLIKNILKLKGMILRKIERDRSVTVWKN